MKTTSKFLLLSSLIWATVASAVIIETEESPGVYARAKSVSGVLQTNIVGTLQANIVGVDPCASSNVAKQSALFNIATAATTALVAPSASTVVFVCSFSMTISQVITTANTIKFIQGTGAACATAPADLTGTYGAGGITAAAPIVIMSGGSTLFKTAAAGGLCLVTAIGATGNFSGVVTYVQQ